MKVQNTQHFENFSLIQNNPSGASRHLPLHKGGFDLCKFPKTGYRHAPASPFGGAFLYIDSQLDRAMVGAEYLLMYFRAGKPAVEPLGAEEIVDAPARVPLA